MKNNITINNTKSWCIVALACVLVVATSFSATAANRVLHTTDTESLVLRCINQCDQVANEVESLGGTVTVRFINVNALAIQVASDVIDQVAAIKGISKVAKDRQVPLPRPITPMSLGQKANVNLQALSKADLTDLLNTQPANYNFNNQLTGATALHQAGLLGEDVVVAVIDTGVANNDLIVPALASSVIGGESFVSGPEEPSATSTLNDGHGTMVSSMIAGHAVFVVSNTSNIVQSLLVHAPDSVIPFSPNESLVPMIGTAPAASIYAMKVFPTYSEFAPSTAILAAMDRVISLRRNYEAGQPVAPVSGSGTENDPFVYDSLNIQVVNMSLGGQTLIPGLELEDVLALEMLKNGIAVVASTGNEGPTALSGGSPGTSVASIAVGAANTAAHERVWLDLQVDLGFGKLYRPNDMTQIASFSSRGPTADGRRGVDVVANGMGSFTQGADGGIYLVAGTSFSAPTVAGAAALLSGAKPYFTATQIRSALIRAANDDIFDERTESIDQGKGFLDVVEALYLLDAGKAKNKVPSLPKLPKKPQKILDDIEDFNVEIVEFDHDDDHHHRKTDRHKRSTYTTEVELQPGQVKHIMVPTGDNTGAITVNVTEIQAELPVEEQNILFGDDIFLTVVDTPTATAEILASEFLLDDTSLEFVDPQHGLMRLAVMGDFTNAGEVRATITIEEQRIKLAKALLKGKLRDGEFDEFQLGVEPGTDGVYFSLDWKGDWGHYPVNDLDLILIDPNGNLWFDAATLRVPEKLMIDSPVPGIWNVIIDGYDLHGGKDRYVLRAYDTDGNNLSILH
jgi:subtilisin family serine protease